MQYLVQKVRHFGPSNFHSVNALAIVKFLALPCRHLDFYGLILTFNLQVSDLTENLSVLQDAYNHLTSRDPEKFWTSGQWMTERKGGSDVGQ